MIAESAAQPTATLRQELAELDDRRKAMEAEMEGTSEALRASNMGARDFYVCAGGTHYHQFS